MMGAYYLDGPNPLLKGTLTSVERDRLRERERLMRAQMSAQSKAKREAEAAGAPLFGAPVRVTPSAADHVSQQVQSKLGDYDSVKQLLEDQGKRYIGIEGNPPASPAPAAPSAASRLQPPPEFKKPSSSSSSHHNGAPRANSHHHNHHGQPRGGFVKPADGKPPYGGRGGYPGQPVKHGGGSNDHRSNGLVPAKGPPVTASASRIHQASKNLPRLQVDQPSQGQKGSGSTGQVELETIFKEMREVATPLSGIATPRKEPDNKFTYNPFLSKIVEVRPAPPDVATARSGRSVAGPSPIITNNLADDLSLSEDSDDEKDDLKKTVKIVPAGRMEQMQVIASPLTSPSVSKPPDLLAPMSPLVASSSSEGDSGSGSDSASESDSSSEESDSEKKSVVAEVPLVAVEIPALQSPLSPLLEAEEEAKPRWNLRSFLNPKTDAPADEQPKLPNATPPTESSPSAPRRESPMIPGDDSESDSTHELDIVVKEAFQKPQPLLSSLSESDDGAKKAASVAAAKEGRRRRRPALSAAKVELSDSDSEAEGGGGKEKPRFPKRASLRRSRQSLNSSDDAGRRGAAVIGAGAADTSTEEDGRGRKKVFKAPPRTPSGSEDEGLKPVVLPERPPKRPAVLRVADDKKRKRPRGRPPKEAKPPPPPPDSSEDEWKKATKVHGKRKQSLDSSTDEKRKDKSTPVKDKGKALQRQSLKEETSKLERRSASLRSRIKSEEQCPTNTSESDSEVDPVSSPKKPLIRAAAAIKIRHSSSDSNWDSDRRRRSLDSDSDSPKIESPPKLDIECKAIQDKKKNDTLRKLFSGSKGGKGGAKGGYGAKGGKGKGGSKTPGIIVDSESERTSNDIVMPSMVSPRLLSPMHSNEPKCVVEEVKVKREKPSKPSSSSEHEKPYKKTIKEPDKVIKRELGSIYEIKKDVPRFDLPPLVYTSDGFPSLICRLDLTRLSHIPSKRRSQEVRTRTELSDTRQRKDSETRRLDGETKSKKRPCSSLELAEESETVIPKCDIANSERSGLKHAAYGCDNEVTTASVKKQKKSSRKKEEKNELRAATSSSKLAMDEDDSAAGGHHKSKHHKKGGHKHRRPSVSSLSSMSTECSSRHRRDSAARSKRKPPDEDEEEAARTCSRASIAFSDVALRDASLVDPLPTNHERQAPSSPAGQESPSYSPGHPGYPPGPPVDWLPPHKVYYSYFERGREDGSDDEERDENQYLAEAKRLKHMADRETDQTAQAMQYLEAALFFLLTGHAMEHVSGTEKTPYTMYNDTLTLIKYISNKFRNQQINSPTDSTVAVLSLRCQSLLHLKLYKMKKHEIKECQKIVAEFGLKPSHSTAMQPGEPCGPGAGGQGTPSALSPTPSPAGSVGSVGSQSSGYNSGELRGGAGGSGGGPQQSTSAPTAPCIAVPLAVHSAMKKVNEHFASRISSDEFWDQADALVYKGKHTDFFIELDHRYGPLTHHSSLKDLVRYVRAGIQRLRELSPRPAVPRH